MRNKYNIRVKKGCKTSKQEDEFVEYMKQQGYVFETQKKFILQESFRMSENEKFQAITYTPDLYFPEDNLAIDYKGALTDVYKIKKKLFMARYGIRLIEVRKAPDYFFKATGYRYGTINAIEICKAIKKEITASKADIEVMVGLELRKNYQIKVFKGFIDIVKLGGKKC